MKYKVCCRNRCVLGRRLYSLLITYFLHSHISISSFAYMYGSIGKCIFNKNLDLHQMAAHIDSFICSFSYFFIWYLFTRCLSQLTHLQESILRGINFHNQRMKFNTRNEYETKISYWSFARHVNQSRDWEHFIAEFAIDVYIHMVITMKLYIFVDHHCDWLNNCIGIQNRVSFLGFITSTFILTLYTFIITLYFLINDFKSLR